MQRWGYLIAVLALVTAVACGGGTETEPETQPGATAPTVADEPTSPAATADDGTEVAEELEPDEDVDESGQRIIEFDSPFTHEDSVSSLAVTGLGITSREWAEGEMSDEEIEFTFGEDGQTIVVLRVEAENISEQVLAWYPNQGQIVLGSEQLDAEVFISDNVGESEWQPGVARDGNVIWVSTTPFEEVEQLGELRYLVNAAADAEDFSAAGEDVDLTVTWEP